jgi:hypothetical protein
MQNRTDINYSYAKGKWALSGNYAFLKGKDRHILETTRTRNGDEDYFRSQLKTDRRDELDNYSNYGLEGQYNFSPNHYLSLQYSGAYESLSGEQSNTNSITYDEAAVYESTLRNDDQVLKNNVSANYSIQADSLGSNLFIGVQYASYYNDFDNDIDQTSTVNEEQTTQMIHNIGANNTGIVSAQVDYTSVFTHEHQLEFGVKYSSASIRSNTTFYGILQDGQKIRDDALSNHYDYEERVPAAYANFKGRMSGIINYSIGLRSEYTHYVLNTSVDEGRKIDDQYLNLFPNASLSTQFSDEANLYLTYSSRINRAPYNRLNPFVVYQDAFTSIQGNPDLRPSIVQSLELGGGYKGWSVKTSYSYTKDPIDGGAFQSKTDPRVYILQRTNLSRGHLYSATLSKNINLPWWRSINTASMSYSNLIDDARRFEVGETYPYYYLYSQNSFDVNDWFTLYVTAWYLSNKQDGINNEKDLSSINIGLEKKVLRDRVIVNLDFNDIFHETRYDGEYTLGLTDIVYANTVNTNYIRLSLTYNFGKLKRFNYKNTNVGESETQRAQ